jgi:hypothetical protein
MKSPSAARLLTLRSRTRARCLTHLLRIQIVDTLVLWIGRKFGNLRIALAHID